MVTAPGRLVRTNARFTYIFLRPWISTGDHIQLTFFSTFRSGDFGHVWSGENNWISLPLPTKTHEARYEERNCGRRVVDFTSLITPTACKDTYVPSGSNKVFSSARFLELSICKQGQLRY